jgi:hypothetical protein
MQTMSEYVAFVYEPTLCRQPCREYEVTAKYDWPVRAQENMDLDIHFWKQKYYSTIRILVSIGSRHINVRFEHYRDKLQLCISTENAVQTKEPASAGSALSSSSE